MNEKLLVLVGLNGSGKTKFIQDTMQSRKLDGYPLTWNVEASSSSGSQRFERIVGAIASGDEVCTLIDDADIHIDNDTMPKLVDAIVGSGKRIICSVHSPLFLNWLDDDQAIHSVLYLYKTKKQYKKVKLFDIPRIRAKLAVMGPGEAYADTQLSRLEREIEALGLGEAW